MENTDTKKEEINIKSIELLVNIYAEKMKYSTECYKKYCGVLMIFGSALLISLGFLLKEIFLSKESLNLSDPIVKTIFLGMPFLIMIWACGYFFLYWDNHTMRLNLDYLEKKIYDALSKSNENININYTWYSKFLNTFQSQKFWGIMSIEKIHFFVGGSLPILIYCLSIYYILKENFLHGWQYLYFIFIIIHMVAVIAQISTHKKSEKEIKDLISHDEIQR